MEIKALLRVLLPLFKATIVNKAKPVPQDANGTVSFVCKSTVPPASAAVASANTIRTKLSGANFGEGITVEDLDVRVTPLKLALDSKAYYVSIFLALNVNESVIGYNIAYSTQGRCITITPVQ